MDLESEDGDLHTLLFNGGKFGVADSTTQSRRARLMMFMGHTFSPVNLILVWFL